MAYQEWLVPKFTNANPVDGVSVSASSQYNTTYVPWKAFNQTNTANSDCWVTVNNTKYPQYLNITFPSPIWVTEFQIQERVGYVHGPKSYNIQIYNEDTEEWVTIYSAVNEAAGAAGAWRPVKDIQSPDNFWAKQVRLEILSSWHSAYVAVGQFKISGYDDIETDIIELPFTWSSVRKGESVTILSAQENGFDNLDISYEDVDDCFAYTTTVFTEACVWAIEVLELAPDAQIQLGAVRSFYSAEEVEKRMILPTIPASALEIGSIILCCFRPQMEEQLEIYIDGELYSVTRQADLFSDMFIGFTYLIFLRDKGATSLCRFRLHNGQEELPSYFDVVGENPNFHLGLPYRTYTSPLQFPLWLLDIVPATFFLPHFLATSEFSTVFWVDSQVGVDTNAGTQEAPFLTIQKAIDSVVVNTNSCIVLAKGSTFVGARNSYGLVYIVANKQITFIGDFVEPADVPVVHSTNFPTIINLSPHTKFCRISFRTEGTAASAYSTSAVTVGMSGATAKTVFQNCYFEPYGISFVWGATAGSSVDFQNCTFNFGQHNYTYESHRVAPTITVNYLNCVLMGVFGQRMTAAYFATLLARYCTYTNVLPTFPFDLGVNDEENSNKYSLSLLLSSYNQMPLVFQAEDWVHSGEGVNQDGTIMHRGVYGGEFAWAPTQIGAKGGFNALQAGKIALDVLRKGSFGHLQQAPIGRDGIEANLQLQYYNYEGSAVQVMLGKHNYGGEN